MKSHGYFIHDLNKIHDFMTCCVGSNNKQHIRSATLKKEFQITIRCMQNMINRIIIQKRFLKFNTDYDVLVFETFLTEDIDVCGLDMISNAEIKVKNCEPLSYI